MKKNIILLVSMIIFELLLSCNNDQAKDNQCISSKIEYVTSINSPTTAIVNEMINIEVNFRVFNGCGEFGKFIVTESGNSRVIEVEAKYVGCICTQDIPIRTTNYVFKASQAGEYELNFRSSPTEFITASLTIN